MKGFFFSSLRASNSYPLLLLFLRYSHFSSLYCPYVTNFVHVSVCDGDIFPACWVAWASSWGVSLTHSFVLCPKERSPMTARSNFFFFYGQNMKVPPKLNVQLLKIKVLALTFAYYSPIWLFSLSFSPSHCNYQLYQIFPKISVSFSGEGIVGLLLISSCFCLGIHLIIFEDLELQNYII